MCVCVGGGGGGYEEQDKMERGLTGKDGDQRPGKGRIGERANPAISCQEGREKKKSSSAVTDYSVAI